MHTSAGSPVSQQLITNATADETQSNWVDVRGYPNVTFYVTGSADTISSGAVSFEEMAPPDLRIDAQLSVGEGKFSSIMTAATAADVTGGAQKAYPAPVRAYCFVRARISTAIGGGGNISVGLVAC